MFIILTNQISLNFVTTSQPVNQPASQYVKDVKQVITILFYISICVKTYERPVSNLININKYELGYNKITRQVSWVTCTTLLLLL